MGGDDLCTKIFRPQLGSVKFLATTGTASTTAVPISFEPTHYHRVMFNSVVFVIFNTRTTP